MIIFRYDKTFEGLLTCLFEAYSLKLFPETLLNETETLPLFYDRLIEIATDEMKSNRVWEGLRKKLSVSALRELEICWLSELPEIDTVLFRYMRKAIDSPQCIEVNFGDADVLYLSQVWKKVMHERLMLTQFARFRKAADDTYLAVFEPIYNALPLAVAHFTDRFSDQRWILYDLRRDYGFYYDLHTVQEIILHGMPQEIPLHADEQQFQRLWKTYFKSISIKERVNPRLHRQHMPVRFWKYLTEKQ